MHSQELKVSALSDYYLYTPSTLASKIFFYPICVGNFYYEANYSIRRNNYDSFLIMYITKGTCQITTKENVYTAKKNQVILIDCYSIHQYGSPTEWEASWLHFDGPLARTYFEQITSNYGYVLSPNNPHTVEQLLNKICSLFRTSSPISESSISKYITNILNELLITKGDNKNAITHSSVIEDSVAYINEHFNESISLVELSSKFNLSPYYFTRVFTNETGFTPHQYIIATRINVAKFLIMSTKSSIKEIAFSTGFNSESSFCSTFKKWERQTPSDYRFEVSS